jgi:hypothetical protein
LRKTVEISSNSGKYAVVCAGKVKSVLIEIHLQHWFQQAVATTISKTILQQETTIASSYV